MNVISKLGYNTDCAADATEVSALRSALSEEFQTSVVLSDAIKRLEDKLSFVLLPAYDDAEKQAATPTPIKSGAVEEIDRACERNRALARRVNQLADRLQC